MPTYQNAPKSDRRRNLYFRFSGYVTRRFASDNTLRTVYLVAVFTQRETLSSVNHEKTFILQRNFMSQVQTLTIMNVRARESIPAAENESGLDQTKRKV